MISSHLLLMCSYYIVELSSVGASRYINYTIIFVIKL